MQLDFLSCRHTAVLVVRCSLVLLGSSTTRMGDLSDNLPSMAQTPLIEHILPTHEGNGLSLCKLSCACLTAHVVYTTYVVYTRLRMHEMSREIPALAGQCHH